ncbi:MAG: hypothetical protein R3Y18_01670 [Bacillota bacterium]
MKKVIAILLVLASVLSLAGCTTSTSTSYTSVWGKSNVLETSVYEITVIEGTDEYFEGAPSVTGTGTYTSTISGGDSEGYTLETVLEFDGTMDFDGKTEDFTQYITSKVTFSDVTTGFAPTYSEKSYNGTTIVYDYDTNSFSSADLEYTSTVVYDGSDAVVTIKNADGSAVANGVATETEYSLSSGTFDNEQIFLVGRSLVKADVESIAFNVLSPITGETSIALYVATADEDSDTTAVVTINGVAETFDTYTVSTQLNSSFTSGASTLYLYAKDDMGMVTTSAGNLMEVDRSRLISFMQQVPYTSSVFSYTMVEYTANN